MLSTTRSESTEPKFNASYRSERSTRKQEVTVKGVQLSIILGVTAVLVCIGLATGLASFFVLQNSEIEAAKASLTQTAQLRADSLARIVTNTVRVVTTINSLMAIGSTNYFNNW